MLTMMLLVYRDQSIPLEVGTFRFCGYWHGPTNDDCGKGRQIAQWAQSARGEAYLLDESTRHCGIGDRVRSLYIMHCHHVLSGEHVVPVLTQNLHEQLVEG